MLPEEIRKPTYEEMADLLENERMVELLKSVSQAYTQFQAGVCEDGFEPEEITQAIKKQKITHGLGL